jgi:hypothetical protein
MSANIYLISAPEDIESSDKIIKINLVKEKNYDPEDVFIIFDYNSPIAARLDYPNIPMTNLVITTTKEKDISKLLKDKKNNFDNDYNIFSGKKILSTNRAVKKDILLNMKTLVKIMYEMLEAGYMVQENRKKISDWIISFQEPIQKFFLNYHKFETSNNSFTFEEEFMVNSKYRQMILTIILKIMANFIINNDLITIDQVSDAGTWLEEKTWMLIREKIKLFNN